MILGKIGLQGATVIGMFLMLACTASIPADPAVSQRAADAPDADSEWRSLLDGRDFGRWKPTDFAGAGEVRIADGAIHILMGDPMTGITWDGEPPFTMSYEISLDARRVQGNDFFCGLTFPVGDDHCTLILGGWGGATTGLSNLSGFDASENETTTFRAYERNRWYAIRLRVEPDRIQAWIDDEQIVDADTGEHWVSIRPEVQRSRPLGIATYVTEGHVRNIRWRPLPDSTPRGEE